MGTVIWSSSARRDLDTVFDYLVEHHSTKYASQVTKRILERSKSLEIFPMMGHVVQELEDENIRELIEKPLNIPLPCPAALL